VQVAQVCGGDVAATEAHATGRGRDGSVGGTPAEHQHAGPARGVVHHHVGDVGHDGVHLGLAGAHHRVVVVRVVGDGAGDGVLLDAADAVLQTGRAGDRHRAGEGLRVPLVGREGGLALLVRAVQLGGVAR